VIRQLGPKDWKRLRDARLRALADAPYAFASTLAEERAFAGDVWLERATPHASRASFALEANGRFEGIASCFVADDPRTVHLVGMWVAREARRAGVGRRLVEAIVDWSREHGAERVCLCVEAGNDAARRLYERCGFTRREPAPTLPYEPGLGADVLVLDL
jgi:ribosomal protein S18 acetylase RimI-like enzyme